MTPAPSMPGSSDDDVEIPEGVNDERIAREAIRFLDRPLVEPSSGSETSDPGIMIVARIRGIDYLDVIADWVRVESELERGPRRKVMDMLSNRKTHLKNHGERDERITLGPRQSIDDWQDGDELTDERLDEIRESRRPTVGGGLSSGSSGPSTSSSSSTSASSLDDWSSGDQELAADGGQDQEGSDDE